MTAPTPPTPTGPGAAMFAHLQEVHAMFRGQLAVLRRAAERWAAGEPPPPELLAAADAFTPGGTGRDLRTHCRYFCAALSMHHSLEDGRMFPGMRAAYPDAGPVLDRLQAEHHVVAEIVEELTGLLSTLDGTGTAAAVSDTLNRLADRLDAHLDHEERVLEPLFGP